MADPLPFFVTLYPNGANPDLANWPEDEQRARAAFLLDVIEAANDEVERIIPNVYYRDWDVENAVIDAREWLDERAAGVTTDAPACAPRFSP